MAGLGGVGSCWGIAGCVDAGYSLEGLTELDGASSGLDGLGGAWPCISLPSAHKHSSQAGSRAEWHKASSRQ